jgi:vitamin B12/bleomycin/antimicrobial peptide transport system ATP-binding/permease protein
MGMLTGRRASHLTVAAERVENYVHNIGHTLAQVARLSFPYFRSEDRWAGRGLLGIILAIELGQVGIAVLLNSWNARFYDALQHKNAAAFGYELLIFTALVAGFILLAVYQLYLSQGLQIRWRQWMTDRLLGSWLRDSTPYRMQLSADRVDNPDQRIAEDVKLFVSSTLSLLTGLFGSVLTLGSFIVILWGLSNAAPLTLFGHALGIPGYLVWIAILYAAAGTLVTHLIGRPLVGLDIEQQRREADFRAGLLRARENAEQIALLKGEPAEQRRLMAHFAKVRDNWTAIMGRQKRLTFFTAGYNQVQVIVPILAAGPVYFAGAISLGGLMQTASAFGRVEGALSFFVKAYPQLALWKSVIERLDGFERSIADAASPRGALEIVERDPECSISAMALDLTKPCGSPLLKIETLELIAGQSTLVTGRSGTGKSSLLRVLAGIWPHAQGRIEIPAGTRLLVLPQRPYLPEGSLRDAITFPRVLPVSEDARVAALLTGVGLSELAHRLDERAHWQQRLSLGEQQRLTVIRAILFEPNWLLLDEATASLDEPAERMVYALLRERLPRATIVSVGHRSTLRALHDRDIDIDKLRACEAIPCPDRGTLQPQPNAPSLADRCRTGNLKGRKASTSMSAQPAMGGTLGI